MAQVCLDIQAGWNVQSILALQRQARIAKANQMLDRAHIDGIGQHELAVDNFAFHSWGQKLGYKCWSDKNFRREFARDNPGAKVIHPGKTNTVGYGS
jgi:hypothetical protein